MPKVTSGTILYIKSIDKYLLGHSTGNKHFDIPKGLMEESETYLEAAIRECKEEFNIELDDRDMQFLGVHKYNKEKNIALFYYELNMIDDSFSDLKCSSMVLDFNGSPRFPEVDYYKLFSYEEMLNVVPKSLNKVLVDLNLKSLIP